MLDDKTAAGGFLDLSFRLGRLVEPAFPFVLF
jgi:hypothetical protein